MALVVTARYAVTSCASIIFRNSRNALGGFAQRFSVELSGSKNGVAEPHGGADGLHNFPVVRGVDTRDHQAKRVGPGVNRREMYGFAKDQRHSGASAEDGR